MFHILYIIVSLCPAFLKGFDFYKVHCSEKRGMLWLASALCQSSALWLAEYLKCEMEMLNN